MTELENNASLSLFPFAVLIDGGQSGGTIWSRPDPCTGCKAVPCLEGKVDEVDICRYGFAYLRTRQGPVIVGAVLQDWSIPHEAYRRVRKRTPSGERVPVVNLERAGEALAKWWDGRRREDEGARRAALDAARQSVTEGDVARILKRELETSASQMHDYANLAIRVRQNAEVLQEKLAKGVPVAYEAEAILQTALLMIAKTDAAWAVANLESFDQDAPHRGVRFHSLILKYLRVYKHDFDAKRIRTSITGETIESIIWCSETHANLLVQNLVDNALKYAPAGSSVRIDMLDDGEDVQFTVSSYGPKIEPKERSAIFKIFYRGEHARNLASGAGAGLALAKKACDLMGGTISVDQSTTEMKDGRYLTNFRVRLPVSAG